VRARLLGYIDASCCNQREREFICLEFLLEEPGAKTDGIIIQFNLATYSFLIYPKAVENSGS
jgi:hypothetical protein